MKRFTPAGGIVSEVAADTMTRSSPGQFERSLFAGDELRARPEEQEGYSLIVSKERGTIAVVRLRQRGVC